MGWQVHGTDLLEWDGPPEAAGSRAGRGAAEGRRARDHRRTASALLVLVADCLPVALVSPSRVAMLHCGWRGLAGGIVERALEGFDFGEPGVAAIGPGIGPCHYEVGPGGAGARSPTSRAWRDGRMLDLKAVAAAKLRAAASTDVDDVDRCTYCEPDVFFSHRRDDGVTGRQGGMVWRT